MISCNGRILASNIRLAGSFWARFKGLMGKKSLGDGEGLLIMRCQAVHCFFMKIPIDAVYLSKGLTVLGYETLQPWSIGRHIKGTAHVLELKAGTVSVSAGEILEFHDVGGEPYDGSKQ